MYFSQYTLSDRQLNVAKSFLEHLTLRISAAEKSMLIDYFEKKDALRHQKINFPHEAGLINAEISQAYKYLRNMGGDQFNLCIDDHLLFEHEQKEKIRSLEQQAKAQSLHLTKLLVSIKKSDKLYNIYTLVNAFCRETSERSYKEWANALGNYYCQAYSAISLFEKTTTFTNGDRTACQNIKKISKKQLNVLNAKCVNGLLASINLRSKSTNTKCNPTAIQRDLQSRLELLDYQYRELLKLNPNLEFAMISKPNSVN